jgi:hypothetical protein
MHKVTTKTLTAHLALVAARASETMVSGLVGLILLCKVAPSGMSKYYLWRSGILQTLRSNPITENVESMLSIGPKNWIRQNREHW